MRVLRRAIVLAVLVAVLAACTSSPVGKAVQVADYETKVVVAAARQVKAMCVEGTLSAAACVNAEAAYHKWRAAAITAANAIAAWKAVSSAGASSGDLSAADAKVKAALDELAPLAKAALDLYRQFVDVKAIEQEVAR